MLLLSILDEPPYKRRGGDNALEQMQKLTLKDRYEISRQINQCGETIVYLGRDLVSRENVTVREFFPKSIMTRDSQGQAKIMPGRDVLYKSLSSDYEELCGYLMKLPEEHPVLRPTDIFWENNTVYSVEGYSETETLDDYLARQGTPLGWNHLKKMIAPLIKLLVKMHSDGIYHRGISPETLLVTKDDRLLLSGFCIPAARTAGSEIDATLYFGYSSPEQYSSSSWQGSWSDVYSLAAVCYRALTGVTPVEWRQRGKSRELIEPVKLAEAIPQNVSEALIKALGVDLSSRYRTIEEFWCALLVSGGGTVTYPLPIVKRSDEAESSALSVRKLEYFKQPTIIALVVISCVAIFSLALAYKLVDTYFVPAPLPAQESSSEAPAAPEQIVQSSSQAQIVVPNLVGMNIEKILLDPLYKNLFSFQIERVFSEGQPAGTVVAQQPRAGSQPNESIYLWVSKGTEMIIMPNLIGTQLGDTVAQLDASEIGYTVTFVETDDGTEEGTVIATSIEAGAVLYRNTDTVVLSVAQEKSASSNHYTDNQGNYYVYIVPKPGEVFWPPKSSSSEPESSASSSDVQ